ncbi:MAG: hypothetical protein ACFB50_15740 [Rubrobacteraceae bacterium]
MSTPAEVDSPLLYASGVIRQLTNTYNVRPKLDEDRRQLLLPREDARGLPPELRTAIKEHREHLLRSGIFLDAHRRFDAWMLDHPGVHQNHPAYVSGVAALGEDGSLDRLNDAWCDGAALHDFEQDLSTYLLTGVRAFEQELQNAEADPTAPPLLQFPAS